MFRRKNYKTRVEIPTLPTELWLVIFDIVIEEGIIWLDECDYTTFPHLSPSFSEWAHHRHFYDSYYQLRLVCRRFNTLLGARPWQSFSNLSTLPLPATTRSLYLHVRGVFYRHLGRLFAETSAFGRLVSLDVDCGEFLSYFLEASSGRAFPNVKRLILRVGNTTPRPQEASFWARLHSGFPLLVTLILRAVCWTVLDDVQWEEGDEVVCFESLEILYFSTKTPYLGCDFPRLRHACVWGYSLPELEILTRSPHLESLLIQSICMTNHDIDVTSCLHLKLLGFPAHPYIGLVPLGLDHPVEHICIYSTGFPVNPKLFEQLSGRLPKLSRFTVEFLSDWKREWGEFRRMRLKSFGLMTRPSDFPTLIFERADTGGIMGRVWRKLVGGK